MENYCNKNICNFLNNLNKNKKLKDYLKYCKIRNYENKMYDILELMEGYCSAEKEGFKNMKKLKDEEIYNNINNI